MTRASAGSGAPTVLGIGGTMDAQSSTETALTLCLAAAAEAGARTMLFGGADLMHLPHYGTPSATESPVADRLVAAVRGADAVIIATPGYHGGVSGLVKNAVDHLEALRDDRQPYLDGKPVGLIVTAHGWQATGSTLAAMRAIVHALRGVPTPAGAAINAAGGVLRNGRCTDPAAAAQLSLVGRQVAHYARLLRTNAAA